MLLDLEQEKIFQKQHTNHASLLICPAVSFELHKFQKHSFILKDLVSIFNKDRMFSQWDFTLKHIFFWYQWPAVFLSNLISFQTEERRKQPILIAKNI